MSSDTQAAPAVQVYAWGLCAMSVCAPEGTPREEIEREANRQFPTGISSRWEIADEPFATGEPNPSPCNSSEGRQHWLLEC